MRRLSAVGVVVAGGGSAWDVAGGDGGVGGPDGGCGIDVPVVDGAGSDCGTPPVVPSGRSGMSPHAGTPNSNTTIPTVAILRTAHLPPVGSTIEHTSGVRARPAAFTLRRRAPSPG